jgi:ATP-dependent helicase YprA (DUF1998 family)
VIDDNLKIFGPECERARASFRRNSQIAALALELGIDLGSRDACAMAGFDRENVPHRRTWRERRDSNPRPPA